MAMPSAEAEYVPLASGAQQLQISKLMCTDSWLMSLGACVSKSDNQAVCAISAEPNGTKRRRSIDLRHELLHHLIRQNELQILHVPAAGQNSDMVSKPMERGTLINQCQTLRIGTVPPNRGSVRG